MQTSFNHKKLNFVHYEISLYIFCSAFGVQI